MKRKHILITSTNFPEGGPGASYLNLFCRGLKHSGEEIKVYLLKGHAFGGTRYTGPRKNETDNGIAYTYLGFRQRPENKLLKLADQFLSLFRLSLLLISLMGKGKTVRILLYNSDLFFNGPVFLMSKIWRIPVFKYVAEIIDRSQFSKSVTGRISRATYIGNFRYLNRISDGLIVFSHYLREEYVRMGYNENRIYVQPNLTDFDYWATEPGEIKFTIGYSGAPYRKDGLHDLLKALSKINETGNQVNLLIAGDATFGESLIPDLKKECLTLGIEESVTFTGLIDQPAVKERLSECRFLAITRPDTIQTKAGFPTKLGEYFALRKPVLATRFGDMIRYFRNEYDIIFADCDDPLSIEQRIRWMLQNENELKEIARRGYATAFGLLEYRSAMEKMTEFLNQNDN